MSLLVVLMALVVSVTAQRPMPPAWPYGQPQLPPGVVPAQVPAQRTPPYAPPAPPAPGAPPAPLRQAAGSTLQFTQQQISNSYGPADWFPDEHPPMPAIVAQGKPNEARACALCHLSDGRGRPENAPLQGLPADYIKQQLRDFQQGLRRSADPRKANTGEMENSSKALTNNEIDEAAAYFSSIKPRKYIRVVEADTIPATRIQGEIYFPTDDGRTEPIGVRVMEVPESVTETQLRNPHSGFVAYVPAGSIKRGESLATTGGGGRTLVCATCHGPDLKGIGPIPNLAGRSPSYLARQMYDMKLGTRRGAMAALMAPVVANLTDRDVVDLMAYVSSLTP
jgi:cytochrome c553